MIDFMGDDFFTELDLVGDPLDAGMPVDAPDAETVAGPDWYSDVWFSDLDPGPVDDPGASELALPDPFQSGTGAGAAGLIGRRFARKRGGATAAPGADGSKSGSRAQSIAAVVQIADTSASLVQRLAGLRKKPKPEE